MSNLRQSDPADPDADVLVRSYAVTHPPGLDVARRRFPVWDQLAYAASGVMEVQTDGGLWVVPPQRAVWIPAGASHALRMIGPVSVRTLYFRRDSHRARPGATPARPCRAVAVTLLLRELVLEICRRGVLRTGVAADERLNGVVHDQLALLPDAPLSLPMPREPRARRLAEALLADPAVELRTAVLGAAASRRTLERVFQTETRLTLGRWHKRARLAAALQRLARGEAPTRVALDVGYRSPSAFVSAFRRVLGRTPGRYFDVEP